jgi:hypothetical protein
MEGYMESTIPQCSSTRVGDEGPLAYELLETTLVRTVPSRCKVPEGAKYIVVKDVVSPFAIPLILLELAIVRRFVPERYSRAYITGGNPRLTFGRRTAWNHMSWYAKYDFYWILEWLHSEGLRYVVIKTINGDSVLNKAVRDFNQEQQRMTHIKIIQARNKLRAY